MNEAGLQIGFMVLGGGLLATLMLAVTVWPLAFVALLVVVWSATGFQLMPLGTLSAPIILGRRRAGEVLGEGWCWLPPGLSDFVSLDNRLRVMEIPITQGFSADRVRVAVKASLQFRTLDPAKAIDLGTSEQAAIATTCAEAVGRFVSNTPVRQAIGRQGTSVPLAGRTLERWSRQYGIGAFRLQLLDITPVDPAFATAMQRSAQQRFDIPADHAQLAAVQTMLRKARRAGLSGQQAVDLVQTERGVINRSATSYRWDGKPMIDLGGGRGPSRKGEPNRSPSKTTQRPNGKGPRSRKPR